MSELRTTKNMIMTNVLINNVIYITFLRNVRNDYVDKNGMGEILAMFPELMTSYYRPVGRETV